MRTLGRMRLVLLLGLLWLVSVTPVLAAARSQQGDPIDYGDTVRDRVTNNAGDEWTFRGQEGDEVWIEMTSSAIDTYLELYGPDGDLLAQNDDSFGTDSLIENYVLSETGRHTIVALSFGGDTGSYTLSLELTDSGVEVGSGGGSIDYGESVPGRVTTDLGDEWTFSGREGDEVRIEMSSGSMDTYLELYGPDGEYLTFSSRRGGLSASNLFSKRADGAGEAERLTESGNSGVPGAWSPGGILARYL